MKEKVLIVEDQFIEANNLQMILEREGYEVCGIARSVPIALKIIEREAPGLVLLDIFLQGPLTGIDLARTLRERGIAFVYISANSNKETLEAAKATYPYGFLVKPFRQRDVLVMLEIAHYLHHNSLSLQRRTRDHLKIPSLNQKVEDFSDFGVVGKSQMLKTVFQHVNIVAPTETSVLILGESGTGKERIGEIIHTLSPRKAKPLIKVNCAAMPASLIESELFGHEKGSFTGAIERRIGRFEQANGGTIFLDEIGELPLEMQSKFLRVLQEKEIERVGGNNTIKIDTRIVAATNRNLEREVSEGRFRMDLYFRLNVFPIQLPPLRERKEDIPLLVKHFINFYSKKYNRNVEDISDSKLDELVEYNWYGNVRELEHVIERSVLVNNGQVIQQLPEFNITSSIDALKASTKESKIKTMEEMERDHILHVLSITNGKISGNGGAADLLGMNVSTLNSKMKKLGIEREKRFGASN